MANTVRVVGSRAIAGSTVSLSVYHVQVTGTAGVVQSCTESVVPTECTSAGINTRHTASHSNSLRRSYSDYFIQVVFVVQRSVYNTGSVHWQDVLVTARSYVAEKVFFCALFVNHPWTLNLLDESINLYKIIQRHMWRS